MIEYQDPQYLFNDLDELFSVYYILTGEEDFAYKNVKVTNIFSKYSHLYFTDIDSSIALDSFMTLDVSMRIDGYNPDASFLIINKKELA